MTRLHTLTEAADWLTIYSEHQWTWKDVIQALIDNLPETILVALPPKHQLLRLEGSEWREVVFGYPVLLRAAVMHEGLRMALLGHSLESAYWIPNTMLWQDNTTRLRPIEALPAISIRLPSVSLEIMLDGPSPKPVSAFFELVDSLRRISSPSMDETLIVPTTSSIQKSVVQQEAPPGLMPITAMGKLMVKAAWQIEQQSGRAATIDSIMKLLGEWADNGTEPDVLLRQEKGGVRWAASSDKSTNGKLYTPTTCRKAFNTWMNSRKPQKT